MESIARGQPAWEQSRQPHQIPNTLFMPSSVFSLHNTGAKPGVVTSLPTHCRNHFQLTVFAACLNQIICGWPIVILPPTCNDERECGNPDERMKPMSALEAIVRIQAVVPSWYNSKKWLAGWC